MKEKKELTLPKLLLLVFFAWAVSGIIIWLVFNDWKESAPFGDTFGFINSFFSALALAAIIYTVYLQKNELKLQREELKFSRIELSRSANAHETSIKMINEQLRISSLPVFEYSSKKIKGEDCIIISNGDNNSAFDIDIWIFKPINKMTIKIEEFIENFVKENKRSAINIEKFTDKNLFYLTERGAYNSFPKNKKIIIPIDYHPFCNGENKKENLCYLFFQYKDALGNNYIQTIEFKHTDFELIPYEYSIFKPSIPIVENRVELIEYFRDKQNPDIAKKFLTIEDNSISVSSMTEKISPGIEGKWKIG